MSFLSGRLVVKICCRLIISPLDKVIAETVLRVGMFTPEPNYPGSWIRVIKEEGTSVWASFDEASLILRLEPTISVYSHHAGKRVAAGVYFEIAAKYAEKVNGTIIQLANVAGCKNEGAGVATLLLAQYPSLPLQWESICNGFREVLLGETI